MMFGFFRRRAESEQECYGLIKLYFSVSDGDSCQQVFRMLLDLYESMLSGRSGVYWVNFGKNRSFNRGKLEKSYISKGCNEVEEFMLTTADDSLGVSLNKLVYVGADLYEVWIVLSSPNELKERFIDVTERLINIVGEIYGYARTLTKDYIPATESKIKRTFWGRSVAVRPFRETWHREPSFRKDMIKGVFQFNIVNKGVLSNINLGGVMDKTLDLGKGMTFVEFSQSDLQEIKNAGQEISRFVGIP